MNRRALILANAPFVLGMWAAFSTTGGGKRMLEIWLIYIPLWIVLGPIAYLLLSRSKRTRG